MAHRLADVLPFERPPRPYAKYLVGTVVLGDDLTRSDYFVTFEPEIEVMGMDFGANGSQITLGRLAARFALSDHAPPEVTSASRADRLDYALRLERHVDIVLGRGTTTHRFDDSAEHAVAIEGAFEGIGALARVTLPQLNVA